jgi:hypothetical protein
LVVAKKDLQQARRITKHLLDISALKGRRRLRRSRRRPKVRRRRAKAPRMSEFGGSSLPRVVQGPHPHPARFE